MWFIYIKHKKVNKPALLYDCDTYAEAYETYMDKFAIYDDGSIWITDQQLPSNMVIEL